MVASMMPLTATISVFDDADEDRVRRRWRCCE